MFTQLLLAVRNITRNKSRTALTLGAIGFGVGMTFFLGGFAQGFRNLLIDDTILARTGALQVHRRGYFDVRESQPLDFDFAQGGEVERKIRAVPGVTGLTPRLVFSGLLNNGSSATTVVVNGIDAVSNRVVLPLAKDDLKGQDVDGAPRGAVLGGDLARALGLLVPRPGAPMPKEGERGEEVIPEGRLVVFQAAGKSGQQNALDATVVGSIDNGNAFESKRVAYVPLPLAQELLGMPGRITEYAVAVTGRDVVDRVAADLQTALGPEYEVQRWQELRPNVADVTGFVRTVLTAVCLVFLVIAIIGVVNTMLMSVLERTREIGTMMAGGVRRGQVLVMFVLEAAVLAVLGSVSGGLLGAVVIAVIAARGGVAANAPGTMIVKHIVPVVPVELAVLAPVAALLGALLAALYPAWRASRLRPVEALRAT